MPDDTQATLGGVGLAAKPAGAVFGADKECDHVDADTGDRCDYYARVAVKFDGSWRGACRSHAKPSWLDAAGLGDDD